MKLTHAVLTITTLISSVLTGCNSPLLSVQPQPSQILMPRLTPNVQAQNVHANYVNLILKTGYQPDNGVHFGFDFANVTYITFQGKTLNLDLRYSAQGRVLWVSLLEQGAPNDQIEHIKQEDTGRLAELARELRKLGAGTAQDKANINRIASLLEHPPVRP